MVIRISGTIDEGTDRYLSRAASKAASDKARLVVIELDTPGGLLSSTRSMVESILSSRVPVAVYVSPPGARAGSAGTFITAAGNFAVMAPGTNIGAASPISSSGEDIPSTLEKKINEDTRAFIRSIADVRGRSSAALEETVTHARSYTANEATEKNVVDFIARDRADLLDQLDGMTAETAVGSVVVRTQGAEVREVGQTLLEEFLSILGNPSVAGLLISIGSLALLVEVWSPGSFGPGVIGVILLVLGFLGAGQLPINWVALGLIAFAMLLFFLEMQAPGVGIFGIGALISFATGLFFLFGNFTGSPEIPEPGTQVSIWYVGGLLGVAATLLISLVFLSRPTGSVYSSEANAALVGQEGLALTELHPAGRVLVSGQEWTASADAGATIAAGAAIRVAGIYSNLLKVTSIEVSPDIARGGAAALVGLQGVAITDLAPSGLIRVAGNEWTTTTDTGSGVKAGEPVEVSGVYANVLKVGLPSGEAVVPFAHPEGRRLYSRIRAPAFLRQFLHRGKIFKAT